MAAVIEVRGVSKLFQTVRAVDNLSFSIQESSIFGLLGSNGAGKSTTINMITGLLIPDTGSITILGMDTRSSMEKIREHLTVVPQSVSLYEELTVLENLSFFGGIYVDDSKELNKRIQEQLELLELKSIANRRVGHLSGGYQRRCSIACALLPKPRILLLDEPLTGIDVKTNELIMHHLQSLTNITIIFTSHSIRDAEAICDSLIFMDKGQKIVEGAPKSIVSKYASEHGEIVSIDFYESLDPNGVHHLLSKEGIGIKQVHIQDNRLRLRTKDIGHSVITILDALAPVREHVKDVNIIKPDLEAIFHHIMEQRS